MIYADTWALCPSVFLRNKMIVKLILNYKTILSISLKSLFGSAIITSELGTPILEINYNNYCLICFSRLRKQIFVFFRVMGIIIIWRG